MNTRPSSAVQPALELDDLRVATAAGRELVKGVSLSVQRGEILALVGESGSGKTMIGRSILGLLPAGIRRSGGRIALDGHALDADDPKQLQSIRGAHVGMVFQEPLVSLNPALTIGRQMAEGLRLHRGLADAEIKQLSMAMLQRIGIIDPERCLASHPHQFSGGMRQRIMLASVMLLKPRLLIADEPTTALDTLTQQEVLETMVGLTREVGTAVLLITHNLGVVGRYAQRVVVLQQGQVVETGRTDAVLARPAHAYTQQLIGALPHAAGRTPRAPQGEPVVSVRNLQVAFGRHASWLGKSTHKHAVKGVDLDIHAGETVAIVGGSGSGKTTFGRALLRLVDSSAGSIRFRGEDITHTPQRRLSAFRRECQIVFQDPFSSLDGRMRVGELVAEALRLVPGLSAEERRQRVTETLADVALSGFEQRLPHELSGGQRQRIAIARAIVARPALVVADEPISALDMTIQQQILTLFETLQQKRGFACLFISHDLAAVRQIADRVIVMAQGEVVEEGHCQTVFDAPQHAFTQRLLAAAPEIALATAG
jgi:peptide/nickel transport system ATP-binding protein